jgi:preprotein translocase subunit SecE
MAIKEDVKRERAEGDAPEQAGDELISDPSSDDANAPLEEEFKTESTKEAHEPAPVGAASPTQLGTRRFVYAGYFAGAIAVAFMTSKLLDFAWLKLQSWRPAIGEPRDEVVMPISGLVGALTALYYWHRTRARQLAEEVAAEMSKVTWPTRTEVTNGTFVVIVTTIISTVFFALMDKFWGFVTNLVYGGS